MNFLSAIYFLLSKASSRIVGNKWQSLLEEESQHSKWEQFRRMAKNRSSHEECSQLLLEMELQDSDEEIEDQDQEMASLEDAEMGTALSRKWLLCMRNTRIRKSRRERHSGVLLRGYQGQEDSLKMGRRLCRKLKNTEIT